MTTWETITPADAQRLRVLLARVRRSGQAAPPLPSGVTETDLSPLTKRDAGKLFSLLHEMLRDSDTERT